MRPGRRDVPSSVLHWSYRLWRILVVRPEDDATVRLVCGNGEVGLADLVERVRRRDAWRTYRALLEVDGEGAEGFGHVPHRQTGGVQTRQVELAAIEAQRVEAGRARSGSGDQADRSIEPHRGDHLVE